MLLVPPLLLQPLHQVVEPLLFLLPPRGVEVLIIVKFRRSFLKFLDFLLVELFGDVEVVHGERSEAGEELRADVVPDLGGVEGDHGRGDGLHHELGGLGVLHLLLGRAALLPLIVCFTHFFKSKIRERSFRLLPFPTGLPRDGAG